MAKIEITKTEMVWPGKYNEDGTLKEVPRVSLPFQVIETVNESRATREAKKGGVQGTLFDVYEGKEGDTFEAGWRNKLIWGDNLLVMGSLLEKFAGKIDLIYIDPPFATGADFSFTAEIGEKGQRIEKDPSVIEDKAYRDTWGRGLSSYLQMMWDRCSLFRDLLKPTGHVIVHVEPAVSPHLRLVLDGIFGAENYRNEIVVHRPITKNLQRQFDVVTALPQGHDVLLWYSCHPDSRVPNLLVPYESPKPEGYWHRFWSGADRPTMRYELLGEKPTHGQWKWERERALRAVANYERFLKEAKGRSLVQFWRDTGEQLEFIRRSESGTVENWFSPSDDKVGDTVWDDVKAYENQKDYATQKHEELLDRVIGWLSRPGGLVADFFCGSGTTLAVAEKLGRRWIGCDLGRWGIHVTRKRLLGIENCKPFEVLNLGKYERQYWQGVTFGEAKDKSLTEQALYEYLAFILKLYGAQLVAGMAHLHGKKGRAMVHIGAVDAPVTIAEIDAAVDECAKLKQGELHVLGWEWEMGLYDLMVEAAKKKGVKLLLLQIPREVMEQQAAAKGDVRFFELAYLEAEIERPKKLTAQVVLKDFVIPNTELIPEDVRGKVKKWSDYIDYWAVDWDFQNDTFMQGWVAYRTRKERKLSLVSDAHTYEKPGKYRILVKVIDIFGNDTSQAFDVDVK
ncbi:MAG TPA: DNA methyltransferase [Burkholderiales bacterium]|nr:DNA methyltransferase [Burkholderiales bacterium]